jgi:hypothetical protein
MLYIFLRLVTILAFSMAGEAHGHREKVSGERILNFEL